MRVFAGAREAVSLRRSVKIDNKSVTVHRRKAVRCQLGLVVRC